jgi:hypothetical protein
VLRRQRADTVAAGIACAQGHAAGHRRHLEGALNHILAVLYGVTSVALVASYAPQVIAVWRSSHGARDVSLLTRSCWSFGSTVALRWRARTSTATP